MSTIIIETLDAEYPVAGVDNDTQGFRDNFQILKDAIRTAKAEIQALEDSAARLDVENNFNGTTLVDANVKMETGAFYPAGTAVNSAFNISFENGPYQLLTLQTSALSEFTINFQDWPDQDRLAVSAAKITLLLKSDGSDPTDDPATVTFTSDTGGQFYYSDSFPVNFNVETPNDGSNNPTHILEFTRIADVIYAHYVGRFAER